MTRPQNYTGEIVTKRAGLAPAHTGAGNAMVQSQQENARLVGYVILRSFTRFPPRSAALSLSLRKGALRIRSIVTGQFSGLSVP